MLKSNAPVVTFDGVSGSGKGTIAQLVAKKLGWHYLDSGALYRVLGYAALEEGVSFDDEPTLVTLLNALELEFVCDASQLNVLINRKDVTHCLRTESIGNAASCVGALSGVRAALLSKQRNFCSMPGLVTDGRDMGSVVFPHAELKFYLDASIEERARRRQLQLQKLGNSVRFTALLKELTERDVRDKTRQVAPLVVPDGAIYLTTDQLTIDQVLECVMERIVQVGLYSI
jgi:cytidylate kinase